MALPGRGRRTPLHAAVAIQRRVDCPKFSQFKPGCLNFRHSCLPEMQAIHRVTRARRPEAAPEKGFQGHFPRVCTDLVPSGTCLANRGLIHPGRPAGLRPFQRQERLS
jgi:hypothetical protein